MACNEINLCSASVLKDIKEQCDNPMFTGMEAVGYWINKNDIESVAYDADNARIVRNITLKAGKRAVMLVNNRKEPFAGTNTAMQAGDYRNTFTETVSFYIPADGADTAKRVVEPIAFGKGVVILINEWEASDDVNKYQVFGLKKGLTASTMTQTKYENNSYWLVEVVSEGNSTAGNWLQHFTAFTPTDGTYSLEISGDSSITTVGYADLTFTPTSGTATTVDMEDIVLDGGNFTAKADGKIVKGSIVYSGESDTPTYVVADGHIQINVSGTFSTSDFTGTASLYTDDTCEYIQGLLSE